MVGASHSQGLGLRSAEAPPDAQRAESTVPAARQEWQQCPERARHAARAELAECVRRGGAASECEDEEDDEVFGQAQDAAQVISSWMLLYYSLRNESWKE